MRLFAAVEVPEPHKRSIEKSIQALRMALVGAVRWVPRENWHATLKFLGEVPDDRVGDVSSVLAAVCSASPSTTTSLTDVGAFPSLGRARVLWAGLEDPGSRMASLASALETAFGEAGFRQESRDLHPHVTLARIRAPIPIAAIVEKAGPYAFDRAPFPVGRLVLYRSHLSRSGAAYEPVETFPLKGS
jgi:RNA 2',3'-cyclic 3'-phosphodiesterase